MAENTQSIPTFKVVLVGSGGSGKTTFVKRHLTGDYIDRYVPTLGVETHTLVFNTTRGLIKLNVWDVAGTAKYAGLGDGYYLGADAFILMMDSLAIVGEDLTYDYIANYCTAVKNVCGELPFVVCGNVPRKELYMVMGYPALDYFHNISVAENSDLNKPIEALLAKLMDDPKLCLVNESLKTTTETTDYTESTTETTESTQQCDIL